MGWSCATAAAKTLDAFSKACIENSGSQNNWTDPNGSTYFFETSNKEHHDGAITGTVWKVMGERCRRSGSFRVEGDGTVTRAPKFLKAAAKAAETEPKGCRSCGRTEPVPTFSVVPSGKEEVTCPTCLGPVYVDAT